MARGGLSFVDPEKCADAATSETMLHTNQPAVSAKGPVLSDRLWRSLLALIFVAATSICLWFNFSFEHVDYSLVGDAGGYTEEADTCLTLWELGSRAGLARMTGHIDTAEMLQLLRLASKPLPDLRMNGPVFPIAIATVFRLAGHDVWVQSWHRGHWYVPVLAQSLLVGLNCLLIALVGSRLFNRNVAVVAGLLAATYPGFIINSCRITTETFACTLMLLLLLLVCSFRSTRHPYISGLALGGLLTVSQLTRSVLVLQWLALVPTSLVKLPRFTILKICLATLFAAALFTAPWLAWQQGRFQQPKPLLDRAGVFNLYVGNDPDRQGWLSLPPLPPWDITRWSTTDVFVKSYKASPSRFIRLQFDKPPRMVKTLWSDFRTPLGPISYGSQVAWHQLVLMLAVVGCCLGVFQKKDARLIPRLVLLEMLAMHAVYFLFAPVARYNLTAMPELLILAAVGLVALGTLFASARSYITGPAVNVCLALIVATLASRLDHWDPLFAATTSVNALWLAVVISVVKFAALSYFFYAIYQASKKLELSVVARISCVLLALVMMPFFVPPLRTYGRIEDRKLEVSASHKIERNIVIPKEDLRILKTGLPYIAVDAAGLDHVNALKFYVNGKPVNAGAIPGAALLDAGHTGDIRPIFNYRDTIFGVFSSSTGTSNTQLRQWFFIPVDPAALEENAGKVKITLVHNPELANSQLFATQRSARGFWALPSFTTYSFDKGFYGSENDDGVTDARFDDHVPINAPERKLTRIPNVFLFVTPPMSLDPEKQRLALLASRTYPSTQLSGTSRQVKVYRFETMPQVAVEDLLFLRLRGQVRSSTAVPPSIEVVVKLAKTKDDAREGYLSEYAPRLLPLRNHQNRFDVMIPIGRRSFFDKPLTGFTFHLNSTAYTQAIHNNPPASDDKVNFSELTADLYRAPGNPLNPGFRVY